MLASILTAIGATVGARVAVLTGPGHVTGTLERLVTHEKPNAIAGTSVRRQTVVDALVINTGTGRHVIPWHAVLDLTLPATPTHPGTT